MALEKIRVSSLIPATVEQLYRAWLDAGEHSAFTGGAATIEPTVGGRFTAWDGYIDGENLELEPGKRIVQSWRSSEFPDGHAHSRLEVVFEPAEGGSLVTVVHTEIPDGQGGQYEEGWEAHYFAPMREYFARQGAPKKPATKKAATKKPAAKKPAAKKPVTKKAAPRKPAGKAAKKRATKKPAPRRPAKKSAPRTGSKKSASKTLKKGPKRRKK